MDDENYRARWARKLKPYEGNGFSLYSDNNPAGRLIVTEDDPNRDSIPRLSRTSHAASFRNDRHGT